MIHYIYYISGVIFVGYIIKMFNVRIRIKYIIAIAILILSINVGQAQLEGGVKIGLSNYDYANPDFGIVTLLNDRDEPEYKLSVDDINWGYHFGGFCRLSVWKLFLQVEALGNSATVDYKIEDLQDEEAADKFLKEQFTTLDIPVQLGIKMKWFNIHGGINGHLPLTHLSELRTIEGYDLDIQNFSFSYLGGIGVDVWKLRFDLRYELSTTLFGDTIQYGGNEYKFENNDNRLLLSVGYAF